MKKLFALSMIFLSFFLFSCGKNTQNTDTGSGKVVEEVENPNDITTQKWYKERLSQRKSDLESFFQTLSKFDNSQLEKLPCKDYYPIDTEHFKSLYDDEQKIIQEYATKCEALKAQAKSVMSSSSGSTTGTGIQSGTGSR